MAIHLTNKIGEIKALDPFNIKAKRLADQLLRMPKIYSTGQYSFGDVTFISVNTTGLEIEKDHQLIEICAIKADGLFLKKNAVFHSLINPDPRRIDYNAFKIHGWNNSDLQMAPAKEKVFSALSEFIGDSVICGYGTKFALDFISPHFRDHKPVKYISILDIIKNEVLDKIYKSKKESNKLFDVVSAMGFTRWNKDTLTSPVNSAEAALNIYWQIMQYYPEVLAGAEKVHSFKDPKQPVQHKMELEFEPDLRFADRLGFEVKDGFLVHPFLNDKIFEFREFQTKFAHSLLNGDSALIFDTGSGKLNISLMTALHLLSKDPTAKVLFLVPLVATIKNHIDECEKFLKNVPVGRLDHTVSKRDKTKYLSDARILFATDKTALSMLKELKKLNICYIVADEAHKINENAEGRKVTEELKDILKTVATATPGATSEEIEKLLKDFNIPIENTFVIHKEDETVNHAFKTYEGNIEVSSPEIHQRAQKVFKQLAVESMDRIFLKGGFLKKDEGLNETIRKIENIGPEHDELLKKVLKEYFTASNKFKNPLAINRCVEDCFAPVTGPEDKVMTLKWELYRGSLKDYYDKSYREYVKSKDSGIHTNDSFPLMKESGKIGSLNHLIEFLIYGQPLEFKDAFLKLYENPENKAGINELKQKKNIRSIYNFLVSDKASNFRDDFFRDPRMDEIKHFSQHYLMKDEQMMIFVNSRKRVQHINEELLNLGLKSEQLWGSSSQGDTKGITPKQREKIIEKYKNGEIKIIVVTEDLLSLGMTTPSDHLMLETPTFNPEKFVQQIGKVGRIKIGHVWLLTGKNITEQHLSQVRKYSVNKMKKDIDGLGG